MPPQFIPSPMTFSSFQKIFELGFAKNIVTSLIVAVSTTFLQLLFAAMAGYALARFRFKGRELLFKILLATMMVPFIIITLPLFVIIRELGWIDSYVALILPKAFSVFSIFFMRQFFLTLPVELEEAAYIDGYSTTQTFFKVILPQMKPALATLSILAFMASWNDLLWPLIASGKSVVTIPVALSQLTGNFLTDWNLLMAGTFLSVIPILLVYLFAQKYVIKGITNTGLK